MADTPWASLIKRTTYKPNVTLKWRRGPDSLTGTVRDFLCISMETLGDPSGTIKMAKGDKLTLSDEKPLPEWPGSDDYGLRIIFELLARLERHEAAEWLKLDGDAKFNPHRPGNDYLYLY